MNFRVSFILPTRNRPEFVKDALSRAQKYVSKKDEFIVVDGSKDRNTQLIVKSYGKLVTKYIHVEDISEGHKMNVGILNSTGRIIKPVSDDDIIYSAAMNTAIAVLDSQTDIDALQCGGEAYKLDPTTGSQRFLFYEKVPRSINIGTSYTDLLERVPCHLGLIYKRSILPLVGLYDPSFVATDINFMTRMIKAGINLKYLDVLLYRHIQYTHSTELGSMYINRDRARTSLVAQDLNSALATETKYLLSAFGLLDNSTNISFLWLVKVLNIFRRSDIGPVMIPAGFIISSFRKLFIKDYSSFIPSQKRNTIWTGKYW